MSIHKIICGGLRGLTLRYDHHNTFRLSIRSISNVAVETMQLLFTPSRQASVKRACRAAVLHNFCL